MSGPEIFYRANTLLKKKWDQRTKKGYLPEGEISVLPKPILFQPDITEDFEIESYEIFGYKIGIWDELNWHRDVHSGKNFPLDFSFSINTRSGQYGNVKVVWEINRLQFLTGLCLKYSCTGDKKYLQRFVEIVTKWHMANPYLSGVNWYSNIEVNLRILTWFICWELLNATDLVDNNMTFGSFVKTTWLPLIELHAEHSYRYPSKFSSANNHLISEATGLFVAGCYWNFKNAEKWRTYGKKVLEREMLKQHTAQGINKEEASEYIQFITDFVMVAYLVGERTGNVFSKNYVDRLQKIFSYIHALMDRKGNLPYYGDDDDGRVLYLNWDTPNNNFNSLMTSAAIIFCDGKFKSRGKFLDTKNKVFWGQQGAEKFKALNPDKVKTKSALYKEEGHFILKRGDVNEELYCHVDVAPLGYLSIAAHGHADALSFLLHVDGEPFIIDTGTYTYHTDPKLRLYFKGTLAHNTIRVDGLDQATYSGPSLWLDHFKVKLIQSDETDDLILIKGSHNGYKNQGIEHRRTYIFYKKGDKIEIIDEIFSADTNKHFYEVPLHLHPEVKVIEKNPYLYEISSPSARIVSIQLDEKLEVSLIKGQTQPLLGWFSPSFLKKEPTNVIYGKLTKSQSFKLKTVLQVKK